MTASILVFLFSLANPPAGGPGETAVQAPVLLRVENFTVPPSTGPVTHVIVKNLQETGWRGTVELKPPEGWKIAPERQNLILKPGETRRVPFNVEKATDRASNSYPLEVAAVQGSSRITRKQNIFCASAPYYAPRIDGQLDEWKDAIPVTFDTGGKKTVVMTYWNKRQFFLAVEVEEDRLRPPEGGEGQGECDAVQFAIAARRAGTERPPGGKAARFEFLLSPPEPAGIPGKCHLLASPETDLKVTQMQRELAPLILEEAEVAVARDGNVTSYECAVPFSLLRRIVRPTVGREFQFSLLVHDPDGTGIRDLGKSAGLWPSQRSRYAWSSWKGVSWDREPPFESKVEWGLCSSKH